MEWKLPVAALVCFISLMGFGCCDGIVPKLTQKEDKCVSKGASVTFLCAIGNSDGNSDWGFLWYKIVPVRDGLPAVIHQSGKSTYSLEPLPDNNSGAGGSYTLNSTDTEHIGVYVCRAMKGDPVSYTEYSNYMFLWVSDLDSSGLLSNTPNRTNYIEFESVSFTCGGNGTGWTLKRTTNYLDMSQCPFRTGQSSWVNGTCHIKAISHYDSGVYWCQSETGEVSRVLYMEVHGHGIQPRLTHDAENQCPSIGSPVTLKCSIDNSFTNWTFQWYRVVPLRDDLPADTHWSDRSKYSLELLPDGSSIGPVGTYTINSTGLENMALYVCRAKKEEPVLYTDYSKPYFLRVRDPGSPSRLSIIPDKTNYVEFEPVSLTCGGNGTGWTLKRITNYLDMSHCPFETGQSSWDNGTCHIKAISRYDSGVYWCQSESGESSDSVTIHVHDATSVIRHESGTWVSYGQQFEQGHPIRMRCVVGSSSEEEWSFRWYRVVSYRDGLLDAPRWSQTDTRYSLEPLSDSSSRKSDGFYTLNSAAPAHSGLYVCRAEKEEPVLHVYSTPTFVWVKDPLPPGLLHISPDTKRFFENETVSFQCDVPENGEWILRLYKYHNTISDIPLKRETVEKATFKLESLKKSDSGVYWCQSESGQLSNIVNIELFYDSKPKSQMVPNTHLALGDPVSLHCSIVDQSLSLDPGHWRFLWYKIVPFGEDLPAFTAKQSSSKYSLELVWEGSSNSSGAVGTYTVEAVTAQHSGVYVCRGQRAETGSYTPYSDPNLLWVTDAVPEANLIDSSNRTQYFESESLSLTCMVQGDTSQWSLRRITHPWYRPTVSDCPFSGTATWDQTTCNISSLADSDKGMYWCQSKSGQLSNLIQISVVPGPRPHFQISPSPWPAIGDTVTLQCEVSGSETGWQFLFYRLTFPSYTLFSKLYLEIPENITELLPGTGGEAHTLTVGPEHSGYYTCRAQKLNTSYQTPFGYPRGLWIRDPSPPAVLVIHPNRSEYFKSESVFLTCDVKGNSSGWTVRRVTQYNKPHTSHCAFKAGTVTWDEMPCSLKSLHYEDSGQYWCQSESGEYSNAVNITVHGTRKPSSFLKSQPNRWLTEGASVKLTCGFRFSLSSSSSDWEFLFYRVVPTGEGKLIKLQHGQTELSVQPLSDSSGSRTHTDGLYNLSSVSLQDSGVFVCRARRQNSNFHSEYSEAVPVWVTTPKPTTWLSLSPNKSMHLQSKSLTLTCSGPGHVTEWAVRRYTSTNRLSDCPFDTKSGSWAGSTCNIGSLSAHDSGVYWCQSKEGVRSNPVNISVLAQRTFHSYCQDDHIMASNWVTEGSAVTLICFAQLGYLSPSSHESHWFKALPVTEGLPSFSHQPEHLMFSEVRYSQTAGDYGETKYSVERLSDSTRGAEGSYTISSTTPKHSGLYVCREELRDLGVYAEYSRPKLLLVMGRSPSAWLYVTPSRSQHFLSDPLTLSCKAKGSVTAVAWTVRRFTNWGELSDCPFSDKSKLLNASMCNISSLTSADTGVYWCQSDSGERSNAINITVHNGNVILESPVHPLRVGERATLRCVIRKSSTSNISARFDKHGKHLDNQTPTTMTIRKTSKSDEGWYSCVDEEKRRSPISWISVRDALEDRRGLRKRIFKGRNQRDREIL
ncbi:basement membrane-specific heparan sulfate proteoglycan core protein-like isoform X2 [Engraulis encrasicolus]|uniref:basement membrane-specific heparan sulfate proteoglycan core protein-like isoform X2 n=1 Tax=Engraulis encrasicolus TaxID=184585 RepID=UPI002FD721B3